MILKQIYLDSTVNKKIDLDLFFLKCKEKTDISSIEIIQEMREELKSELLKIDSSIKLIKADPTASARKSFLLIKRKIITNILSYTKERLRLINLVVCNSVSLNTTEKFFRMAAKILPAADFQHILGKCITEQEIEQDKLGFIKEFMKDISIGNR